MSKTWKWSLAALAATVAIANAASSYTWKSVVIGGGGFVDGFVFHPTVKGLMYSRTDMGGAYRWNAATTSWIPITDHVGAVSDDMGILSIALDPQDGSKVYLLTGKYSNAWTGERGHVFVSSDTGRTFTSTTLPLKNGGNLDGRGCGERLAVDPNKSGLIFLAGSAWDSSKDGVKQMTIAGSLWKSANGGTSFDSVATGPVGNGTFLLFDPASGTKGTPSTTIYAGMDKSDNGAAALWRSKDGGATWAKVPGQPAGLIPCSGSFDGATAYFSFNNGIGPNGVTAGKLMRLDISTDSWTDVSPVKSATFGYGTPSPDRQNPGHLVVSSVDKWEGGDDVWLSRDGGNTWIERLSTGSLDLSFAPWKKLRTPHWLASVQIDPFDSTVALFGTGYGVFRTTGLRSAKPVWAAADSNLEECVSKNLVSPSAGVPLVTSVGDQGGWRHISLDKAPVAAHTPDAGSTMSIDVAWNNPAVFVRAHMAASKVAKTVGGISLDSAKTWTDFATQPAGIAIPTEANGWAGDGGGIRSIALNATGTAIVWTAPGTAGAFVSRDNGKTWKQSTGDAITAAGATPVGDKVNPAKFYLYDTKGGKVLTSSDTGASFVAGGTVLALDDWESMNAGMVAVPGYEGHVLAAGDHAWGGGGLYASVNSGTTMRRVANVASATKVAVGRAPSGKSFPSVFIVGKVGSVYGFFRSDDSLKTWNRINDDRHQFGTIHQIVGDSRIFGRLYIGTEGRGVIYGDDTLAVTGVSKVRGAGVQGIHRDGLELLSAHAGIALVDQMGRAARSSATRTLDLRGLARGVYFARSGANVLKVVVAE